MLIKNFSETTWREDEIKTLISFKINRFQRVFRWQRLERGEKLIEARLIAVAMVQNEVFEHQLLQNVYRRNEIC